MAEPPEEAFEKVWASLSTQDLSADPIGTVGRQSLSLSLGEAVKAEPATDDPLPRLTLAVDGDLEVKEPIGQGGMGKVELAVQRCLGREVALKSLRDDADDTDEAALIQEARFTGTLEHPNIVPVHLLGRDEQGSPLLLMKRVSGIEWLELLRDPDHPRWADLPTDRLAFHVGVLKQVCNALHFAHSRGVLHRDVKPANVMIGEFGEVYLLDWGLATRLDEERSADAPIVGTPSYFAPEMADVSRPLTVRTDVYLLGATLHHVLTGEPRHTRGPDGMRSVIYAAFLSEPQAYGFEVPAELAVLCNAATSREPEQRPESALAFRRRLEEFEQHRGSVLGSERAGQALDALAAELGETNPGRERVVALFTEARVGFEQALEAWPGNAAARAGLQQALELRIAHELDLRNKGAAEELLLALPEARPALEQRLGALRSELSEDAQSTEALRDLREDLDVTYAGPPRAALFLLVGSLAGVGVLTAAFLAEVGQTDVPRWVKLAYQLILPAVFLIGVFAVRKTILRTTANRKLAACVFLVLAAPIFASGINHFIQPTLKTGALSSFIQTLVLTTMAIAFDARIAWIGLITFLIAAACLAWPERALLFQGAGTFLAFAVAAAVTLPRGGGDDPDPSA